MNGAEPIVRDASAADFERLCAVDRAAYGDHAYDRYALRQFIALFPRSIFVAEDQDGRALGMAVGGLVTPGRCGWVLSVAVVPEARGRGIGRRLAERVTQRLRELGAPEVRLTVAAENVAARALYESLGYRLVASDAGYFGPGESRLVLQWTPPSAARPGTGARATLEFVAEFVSPGSRVLEVGCGDGELAAALSARGDDVTALDRDPRAVERALARGVSAHVADWPQFEAAPFDAVLFTRSLHHMSSLDAALDSARALLRPGGAIVVEDFAFDGPNAATLAFAAASARLAIALGAIAPAPGSLLAELSVADDLAAVWRRHLDHGLHGIEAIFDALSARASIVHASRCEYLFRYFESCACDPSSTWLDDLRACEMALEPGAWLGRRLVGRRPV